MLKVRLSSKASKINEILRLKISLTLVHDKNIHTTESIIEFL